MNIQTKQPSAYAPTQADPLRLASATIQAVDRIGETTSEEIERTANEITHGAAQIAQKLLELASAGGLRPDPTPGQGCSRTYFNALVTV